MRMGHMANHLISALAHEPASCLCYPTGEKWLVISALPNPNQLLPSTVLAWSTRPFESLGKTCYEGIMIVNTEFTCTISCI